MKSPFLILATTTLGVAASFTASGIAHATIPPPPPATTTTVNISEALGQQSDRSATPGCTAQAIVP